VYLFFFFFLLLLFPQRSNLADEIADNNRKSEDDAF